MFSSDWRIRYMLTKCKDCKYSYCCRLDSHHKMHSGKCYIDELIRRRTTNPQNILDICYDIETDIGIEVYDIATEMHKPQRNWDFMNQPQKRNAIKNMIRWYISLNRKNDKSYIAPLEKVIKRYTELLVEICDCAFNTHRNGVMVKCLRCGALMPNNKQHNRKYCDNCRGYEPLFTIRKICPDCGKEFNVDTPNNRQFRCDECQTKANKEQTRLRVQKYREREKCNDIK